MTATIDPTAKRKKCSKCGSEHLATREFFYLDGGRLRADCKPCFRGAAVARYHRDPAPKIAAAVAYQQADRERRADKKRSFKDFLDSYRHLVGCADCGVHEGNLDLHHLDPLTREESISGMAMRSLDAIDNELSKCIVLCRSCHQKRHKRGLL